MEIVTTFYAEMPIQCVIACGALAIDLGLIATAVTWEVMLWRDNSTTK